MYRVNLAEAAPNQSPYPSFDAFFTRKLREGARPVCPDALVSPADGVLSAAGAIEAGAELSVKGKRYLVDELIGSSEEGRAFAGGAYGVVYLNPADYHRVHAPVDGEVRLVRGIPGDYFPVNAFGEENVEQLYARNNRVFVSIETQGLGRVGVVFVGAMIVGRITVTMIPGPFVPAGDHRVEPAHALKRGDELGMFHLGSTIVLLLEPGTTISRALGRVRYGESLLSP
jgi:phosphatidylserine decarboxylase